MKLPIRKINLDEIVLVRDAHGNPVPLAEINAALARAEKMEGALERIAEGRIQVEEDGWPELVREMQRIARAALADEEPTE